MSIFCQQQGGAVFGKVFHDTNQNGLYEPHLGETGFHSPTQPLVLELIDCDSTSLSCDRYNYALPWYNELRRFPISIPVDGDNSISQYCPDPQNGGCFAFECQDCRGTYKVRLSREVDPVEQGWNTSPMEKGHFREGWIPASTDPPVTNVVQNNFDSFESVCFNMMGDINSMESYKVVLDLGVYLDDDVVLSMIGDTRIDEVKTYSQGDRTKTSKKKEISTVGGFKDRPDTTHIVPPGMISSLSGKSEERSYLRTPNRIRRKRTE